MAKSKSSKGGAKPRGATAIKFGTSRLKIPYVTAPMFIDLMANFDKSEPPRSSKRRKPNHSDLQTQSVDVQKSSTTLQFAGLSETHLFPRHYTAVQDDVCVEIINATEVSECKVIIKNNTEPSSSAALRVPGAKLQDVLSTDFELALKVASHVDRPSNPVGPGRLWTQIDFELIEGRDNGTSVDELKIICTIKWNTTESLEWVPRNHLRHPNLPDVLATCFPPEGPNTSADVWSPQDFYTSVHVPDKDDTEAHAIVTSSLETDLFPFQKRALKWLLNREGVRWSAEKGVFAISLQSAAQILPYSFRKVTTGSGEIVYISKLFALVTKDVAPYRHVELLKGGVLSEEMGLGKTVEMIALMSLHRRDMKQAVDRVFRDLYSGETVRPVGTTLIITPPSILQQWMRELRKHAPNLKAMHYQGISSYRDAMTTEKLADIIASCDVVLTTYNVLSAEIHYTTKPPDRSMRHAPKHPRPKSVLTMLSWWRVCLDEAQMIESGVSSAAQVARLIPRVNAWGVTGTPMKRDVADLLGLLCFLRLEPFATLRYFWDSLVTSHKDDFKQLFSQLALRHTKHYVRDELHLPGQQRHVITLPFTPIEEQYYLDLYHRMCAEIKVDLRGEPLANDWDPDSTETTESMRSWLQRLRQCVLHPEVGGRNRRALGNRDGPLRTVEEVLQVMLEQSDISIRAKQREVLLSKLKRGQYYENSPRVQEALDIWTEVRNDAAELVADARQQLTEETKIQMDETSPSEENSDDDNTDADAFIGSKLDKRIGTLRNRVRTALEVEHVAVFFQANAYFQIKSNETMTEKDSDDFRRLEKLESDGYDLAKKIRQEILQEVFRKANRFMRKLKKLADSQSFIEIPEFPEYVSSGGIENRGLLTKLNTLGAALDAQANQIDEWREATIQLLLNSLIDAEDDVDITGDEYEVSTKLQDEVVALITALRTVIEDRYQTITGQENILITGEAKTALKLAEKGQGPAPEKLITLLKARDEVKPPTELGNLRRIAHDIRARLSSLNFDAEDGSARAGNEYAILSGETLKLNELIQDQLKAVEKLRQEMDLITRSMNIRLEFYRQLQQVSDMVQPLEDPANWRAHDRLMAVEKSAVSQVVKDQSRRRFLLHLRNNPGNEARRCVICLDQIEIGSLTVCGHQFCKACMLEWWRAHKTCPTCKRRLTSANLQDISYKPREAIVVQELAAKDNVSELYGNDTSIYSQISTSDLTAIQNIELRGPSFGTKVDTIARHIIWLRESDPGAKSIVFSLFKDFLDVLGRALRTFRIGYSSMDKAKGIESFQSDAAVECFLLHGKAQSSGLNLVVASHVFLCEPLINTALELQAIARVDRIGQHQKTNVYLYLIQHTVEQAIYDISIKRRLAHLVQSDKGKGKADEKVTEVTEGILEHANSSELQRATVNTMMTKEKGGGEVVDQEDLWGCLFGNTRRAPRFGGVVVGAEINPLLRNHLAAEAAEARITDLGEDKVDIG